MNHHLFVISDMLDVKELSELFGKDFSLKVVHPCFYDAIKYFLRNLEENQKDYTILIEPQMLSELEYSALLGKIKHKKKTNSVNAVLLRLKLEEPELYEKIRQHLFCLYSAPLSALYPTTKHLKPNTIKEASLQGLNSGSHCSQIIATNIAYSVKHPVSGLQNYWLISCRVDNGMDTFILKNNSFESDILIEGEWTPFQKWLAENHIEDYNAAAVSHLILDLFGSLVHFDTEIAFINFLFQCIAFYITPALPSQRLQLIKENG